MPKEKTLNPTRPNAGLEAAYRKKLEALIDDMATSIRWWVLAAYKQNEPEMAQDALPAKALQRVLDRLRKQWQGRFDEEAPNLASWFARTSQDRTDRSFAASLKTAGFSVKFNMTPEVRDILAATTGENVSLIKSIASEHFTIIEGAVMRAVSAGRDVGSLAKEIEDTYGVSKRRAALISRDQTSKATANVTRARQERLGITEAIWKHSRGGRHPRPSHVAADGKRYKIADGMMLDGVQCWPGSEINCRCQCRSLLPHMLAAEQY